jgi:hypothetical protein
MGTKGSGCGCGPAPTSRPVMSGDRLAEVRQRIQELRTGVTSAPSGEAGPTSGITGIVPARLKDTKFARRESSGLAATTPTSLINVDFTFPVATATGSPGALAMLEDVEVMRFSVPTPTCAVETHPVKG